MVDIKAKLDPAAQQQIAQSKVKEGPKRYASNFDAGNVNIVGQKASKTISGQSKNNTGLPEPERTFTPAEFAAFATDGARKAVRGLEDDEGQDKPSFLDISAQGISKNVLNMNAGDVEAAESIAGAVGSAGSEDPFSKRQRDAEGAERMRVFAERMEAASSDKKTAETEKLADALSGEMGKKVGHLKLQENTIRGLPNEGSEFFQRLMLTVNTMRGGDPTDCARLALAVKSFQKSIQDGLGANKALVTEGRKPMQNFFKAPAPQAGPTTGQLGAALPPGGNERPE